MDTRLEKALEFSNYMVTLNNQRRVIHEQFLENCVHYINGGKFSVNRELINFCKLLVDSEQSTAILVDDNNSPIEIENLQDFLDEILNIYFTNVNSYHNKYNEIKNKRSIKDLIDL